MYEKERIKNFRSSKCDKCGNDVPKANSALLVQEVALGKFAGFVMDRHLYPIEGCEGSPSRVHLVETDSVWAVAYAAVKEQA